MVIPLEGQMYMTMYRCTIRLKSKIKFAKMYRFLNSDVMSPLFMRKGSPFAEKVF